MDSSAGSGFASKYTVNKPSAKYTTAVDKVRQAPKGTTISQVGKVTAIPAMPKIVTDVIANPVGTVITGITNALYGSKEQQVEEAAKFIPGKYVFENADELTHSIGFDDWVDQRMNEQKKTPEGQKFWESPGSNVSQVTGTIDLPELKLPDVGGWLDTAKWVLIGWFALVGVYLISKSIGGKK